MTRFLSMLLFGGGLALLGAAAPQRLTALLGVATDHTVWALLGMSAGVFAALYPSRRAQGVQRSEVEGADRRHLVSLVLLAVLCLLAAYWIRPASDFLVHVCKQQRGSHWTSLTILLVAAATLGPLAYVATRATLNLLEPPGRSSRVFSLSGFLLGFALGLAAGPFLIDSVLGTAGAPVGTAVLTLIALVLSSLNPRTDQEEAPPDANATDAGTRWWYLAAALAGFASGPVLIGVDLLLARTENGAFAGPCLLLAAASAGVLGGWLRRTALLGACLLAPAALVLVYHSTTLYQVTGPETVARLTASYPREHLTVALGTSFVFSAAAAITLFWCAIAMGIPAVQHSSARRLRCLLLFLVFATLSRLAPHSLPLLTGIVAYSGLALICCAVLIILATPGRSRLLRFTACIVPLLMLPFALKFVGQSKPGEAMAHPMARVHTFEPNGSLFELREMDAAVPKGFLDGFEVGFLRPGDPALHRLVLMALAVTERPHTILVLGPGGAPLIDSLLAAQSAPVTWVTPLRGEARFGRRLLANEVEPSRLTLIWSHERAFVEAADGEYDLVFLSQSGFPPRRNGFCNTTGFSDRILERLATNGIVVRLLPLASQDPATLVQQVLPSTAATVGDLVLFLDHPMNTRPMVAFLMARDPIIFPEARIVRRLAELGDAAEPLRRAGLDARGILQCFLFDKKILELWLGPTWENTDDRPRLAYSSVPPIRRIHRFAAGALNYLLSRRILPVRRLEIDKLKPGVAKQSLDFRNQDFEATTRILAETARAIRTAAERSDPAARDPLLREDSDVLWQACRVSPTLALCRDPLNDAVTALLDQERRAEALAILHRLRDLEARQYSPGRKRRQASYIDLLMKIARLERGLGRIEAAEDAFREITDYFPTHYVANYELGLLIASAGQERRPGAAPFLEQALAHEALPAVLRAKANLVLPYVNGDLELARTRLEQLPPTDPGDPLLRFIRDRLLRPATFDGK